MLYLFIEYLHVLGAIVILGTGTGIAFFMLMAHRSGDAAFIARTAEVVVIADFIFTLSSVLLQPVTGGLLMWLSSTAITEGWLMTLRYAVPPLVLVRHSRFRFCHGDPLADDRQAVLEHDPDPKGRVSAKWAPVFGQDHAQDRWEISWIRSAKSWCSAPPA
jgi:hypothetical protein